MCMFYFGLLLRVLHEKTKHTGTKVLSETKFLSESLLRF